MSGSFVPGVRKPTGVPAAPLVMVSGPAKSGKSMTAYKLGADPRIAHTWVLDLGEGSADEYAELDSYSVLEWGRSWADLADSVRWCIAQPVPAGQLNAVIIDSGTELWEGLKQRADARARNSKKNRAALARDPDFEVDVSMPFWTDAADTWARIVSPLRLAGHIVGVVLVRSDDVAEVVNGVPTGNRVTSLQAHKSLPAAATAHVQIRPDHTAWLIEVRSMRVTIPTRGLALTSANPLGELVAIMAPPAGDFGPSNAVTPHDEQRLRTIDASQAAELVALMNSIDDEDVRAGLKRGFINEFGKPDKVHADAADRALQWVRGRLARLAPESTT